MSRIGAVAGQGRETFDGARKEIAQTRQESLRHRPDPPEEGVYCIQGVYADFPDMVFIITDQDGTPREGNCPTS